MYECVGVDVGWKRRGSEAEKKNRARSGDIPHSTPNGLSSFDTTGLHNSQIRHASGFFSQNITIFSIQQFNAQLHNTCSF